VHLKASTAAEARQTWQAALALRDDRGHESTLLSLTLLNNLARVAQHDNDIDSQVGLHRQLVARSAQVLGEHHPWHLTYTATLAWTLARAGRPGEARRLLQRAEPALARDESGQVRGWVMLVHGDLARGRVDHEDRDLVAARQSYQAVLDDRSASASDLYGARMGLGFVAAQEGREAEMHALLGQVVAETPYENGAIILAEALIDLGRPNEAVDELGAVLARCAALDPAAPEAQGCHWSRYQLGRAYQQLGEHAAAERVLAQQAAIWEPVLAPHDLGLLAVRRTLGEAVLDQGRFDEAAAILRAVEATYAAAVEPDYVPLAHTRLALARALTGEREAMPADAAALAEQGLAALRAHGATFADELQAQENRVAGRSTGD
ncbi:MAG TPA: tetratricopeptide repeat protein, partial [Nannocystis sp.]|jgi:tetratricopeptide (TPR) repeat protein